MAAEKGRRKWQAHWFWRVAPRPQGRRTLGGNPDLDKAALLDQRSSRYHESEGETPGPDRLIVVTRTIRPRNHGIRARRPVSRSFGMAQYERCGRLAG